MAEDVTPGRQILKGIKVKSLSAKDLIDFDGDCFDPYALLILEESLDYAIEISGRRLNAMNKIFPEAGLAKDSATGLALLEEIKNALMDIPKCPPARKPPIKAELIPPKPPKPPKPPTPPPPKEEKPVIEQVIEKKPPVPRIQAETWNVPVEYEGKIYESPTALARVIEGKKGGIKVNEPPAASNAVHAFTRTGCFKVYSNGEERTRTKPGSKTEGKFRVVRTSPDCIIPEQYKLPPRIEQIGVEIIKAEEKPVTFDEIYASLSLETKAEVDALLDAMTPEEKEKAKMVVIKEFQKLDIAKKKKEKRKIKPPEILQAYRVLPVKIMVAGTVEKTYTSIEEFAKDLEVEPEITPQGDRDFKTPIEKLGYKVNLTEDGFIVTLPEVDIDE